MSPSSAADDRARGRSASGRSRRRDRPSPSRSRGPTTTPASFIPATRPRLVGVAARPDRERPADLHRVNTLRTPAAVPRGAPPGATLPPFAAPLALGPLLGDANVAIAGDRVSAAHGRRARCAAGLLNRARSPRARPRCSPSSLRASPPARRRSIGSSARGGAPGRARGRRAWPAHRPRRPAPAHPRPRLATAGGYDRDGAVFALYGVVDCPTVVFAYPGGVSMVTTHRPLPESELGAQVRRLVDASRRRGWKAGGPDIGDRAVGIRSRVGRRRHPRGVPRPAAPVLDRRRAGSAQPARGQAAPARHVGSLPRLARREPAPGAGAVGLPRVLPSHRPRPRRRPHADRGGRARASAARRLQVAQPRGRRAARRAGGDRCPRLGPRRGPRAR